MEDLFSKVSELLLDRVDAPLKFRLFIQPLVAILLAIRDGRADAKVGKTPYFWSLFTDSGTRVESLREGWKSVSKVFLLALVLDCVYQFLVLPRIYPLQAFFVAVILAFVPYLIFRGLATRIFASAGQSRSRAKNGK